MLQRDVTYETIIYPTIPRSMWIRAYPISFTPVPNLFENSIRGKYARTFEKNVGRFFATPDKIGKSSAWESTSCDVGTGTPARGDVRGRLVVTSEVGKVAARGRNREKDGRVSSEGRLIGKVENSCTSVFLVACSDRASTSSCALILREMAPRVLVLSSPMVDA